MRDSSSNLILRDTDNGVGRKLWPLLAAVMISLFALIAMGRGGLWVVLIVAAVGAYTQQDRLRAAVQWQAPQLEIERTPYALGSQPVVAYHRKFRSKVIDLSACRIECRLVCEEKATYRQGSSTRTDTETVFEQSFSADGEGTSEGLIARVPLEIPATAGAPTFDLGANEVRWYLETRLEGAPAAPRDKNIFSIDVGPTLDPRLAPGVQDS